MKTDSVQRPASGGGNPNEPAGAPMPVKYTIVSGPSLSATVERCFGIVCRGCRLIRRGFHDTYLVEAEVGRYVARVYRAEQPAAHIRYELELLAHLSSSGVSVSAPLLTKTRDLSWTLASPEGVRHLALFTFAGGSPLDWSNARQARDVGSLLARLHSAGDRFTTVHSRPARDLALFVDDAMQRIRPFMSHRPADWAELTRVAAALRLRTREVTTALEWGVCHGDFTNSNIHVTNAGALTVFDFDFCGESWRATDFVPAWWNSRSSDADGWEAFLDGYRAVRPIPEGVLEALPTLHALMHVWSLSLRAGNATHRGLSQMNDRILDAWMAFLGPLPEGLQEAPR